MTNYELKIHKNALLTKLVLYYQDLIPPGDNISRAELLASLETHRRLVDEDQL